MLLVLSNDDGNKHASISSFFMSFLFGIFKLIELVDITAIKMVSTSR
jgi:hypothetical protein